MSTEGLERLRHAAFPRFENHHGHWVVAHMDGVYTPIPDPDQPIEQAIFSERLTPNMRRDYWIAQARRREWSLKPFEIAELAKLIEHAPLAS